MNQRSWLARADDSLLAAPSIEVVHLIRHERHRRNMVSASGIQRHRLTGSQSRTHAGKRHCCGAVVDAEAAGCEVTSTSWLNIKPEDTSGRELGIGPAGNQRCARAADDHSRSLDHLYAIEVVPGIGQDADQRMFI